MQSWSPANSKCLRDVHALPMLSFETEQNLFLRWCDHHDISAAHQLVGSHLCMVIKTARACRGYGVPQEDLIGEGHMGLMRAVCRFDPSRGGRFATYAIWWVRAAILECVMRNWLVVKRGTAAQKRLFFNMLRTHTDLCEFDNCILKSEHVSEIATPLAAPEREVITMDQRMASPRASLNAQSSAGSVIEWQNWLADDSEDQKTPLADKEETTRRNSLLPSALERLTTRERQIIVERHLKEKPTTLEDLSQHFRVSPERIRQIEMRAITKLKRMLHAPVDWHPSAYHETAVADVPPRRVLE